MIAQIMHEDCRTTLQKNLVYDYVFTSPPDFEEIGTSPDDEQGYAAFLHGVFSLCRPTTGLITVAFTDRKYDSRIVSKSHLLKTVMFALGYVLTAHKVLVKSTAINMFRLNYMNVLSFGRGKTKQWMAKEFKPDVWMDDPDKYKGYAYGMPVGVPRRCILNYTQSGDVVYDPFLGSGTTAVAAIQCGRGWLGSEISAECCQLVEERITTLSQTLDPAGG
jgi:DNA modification methylase